MFAPLTWECLHSPSSISARAPVRFHTGRSQSRLLVKQLPALHLLQSRMPFVHDPRTTETESEFEARVVLLRCGISTPPYVRFGSFTTDAVEATRACMSAVARKRTSSRSSRYVRLVPEAAVSNHSNQHIYSITSSASESRLSEIFTPSALAVLLLITNSDLVDCSTGSSAGFAPRRMRPA